MPNNYSLDIDMSVKEQMAIAKAYIKDKQYDKARKILKGIQHPTAEKWLNQLNKKYPQKVSKYKKTTRIMGAIIVSIVIVFVVLIALSKLAERQRLVSMKPEAHATLVVFCTLSTTTSGSQCRQWADDIVDDDLSNVWRINFCGDLYSSVVEAKSFYDCLNRGKIYLP
jgi:cobalamin biosynthesis protein CobD/CbiB